MNTSGPEKHDTDPTHALEEIGREALSLARGTGDLEKFSKAAEIANTSAIAREALSTLGKFQSWVKWLASLATSLTLIVALVTLYVQGREYKQTIERQQVADEDTQWREAMKSVSFKDPSQALVAAMWMQSFAESPRYRVLSRRVTVSLLPVITNVTGFDDVLTNLVKHTDSENQLGIIDVAQKVSSIQWGRFGEPPAGPTQLPFVKREVLGIDFTNAISGAASNKSDFNIAAWEVDTASHALWDIWVRDRVAKPKNQNLTNIVLENNKFYDDQDKSFSVDFTNATLKHVVLANASFQRANFTNSNLSHVIVLENVDLSEITQFGGSDWSETHWWKAKYVSFDLCKYLQKYFPPPSAAPLPDGCIVGRSGGGGASNKES
jgi:hypothetical protein